MSQASENTAAMSSGSEGGHLTKSSPYSGDRVDEEQAPAAFTGEADSLIDEELERTNTRLSRTFSIPSRTFSGSLPRMGKGKAYPALLEEDDYLVDFEGPNDPELPINWPIWRKIRVTGATAWPMLCLSWGSACYAASATGIMEKFHVGQPVAALGVSLYVFGFAAGPVLWGPLSEVYGRKIPMVLSSLFLTAFSFGAATAKDYQTLMLCRFFCGLLGSAPIIVVAACFADMYKTEVRGKAMTLFALTVMGGPMISPVVSGFMAASYLGWRWPLYLNAIMVAAGFVLIIFAQDETYGPVILNKRANEIKERTKNWAIHTTYQDQSLDFKEIVEKLLTRPLKMLVVEPILLLMTLYNGLVYGILYMSLEAVPMIFQGYGWKGGVLFLPYIAIFIGCVCAGIISITIFEPKFVRDLHKSGKAVLPEARLPFMMLGSIFFCIGIFWLCWCGAYPESVHWLAPVFGAGFYGFGFISLFIPVFSYIIDSYLMFAASALAGNAFLRGGMGAAFPLFSSIMFRNLGIQWAGTLIGCLAALMLPVPFLFYRYGAWLRTKSLYAVNLDTADGAPKKED